MSRRAPNIAVIDYGMGNLHSVSKALQRVCPSASIQVTANAASIAAADRVVFPGVGAMRDCMAEIRRLELDTVVKQTLRTKPLLAICVGMQALMAHSEENGGVGCLNLFPGRVKRFASPPGGERRLKVPHMGWNRVQQSYPHPLWKGIDQSSRLYFIHSYYVEPSDASLVVGTCDYGVNYACAIAKDNLFAVQFHPEKSANVGLKLLQNFAHWNV